MGFRAESASLQWAAVEGSQDRPTLTGDDEAAAPVSYSEAEALAWYRKQLLHLIETHKPDAVAVRYAEAVARGAGREGPKQRCRIEGVILEVAGSKSLKVYAGALATISKNLGTKSAKQYLEGEDLRGLDWSKRTKARKEAILAAVSALPSSDKCQ